MAVSHKVEPYRFDPKFERSLITLLCQRPKLFARIGYAIEVDALGDEISKTLLRAALMLAHELGVGPNSTVLIGEKLWQMREDGKIKDSAIDECWAYLDETEDAGLLEEEHVAKMVIPKLQERAQHKIVMEISSSLGRKDISHSVEQLNRALHLGDTNEGSGVKLGSGSFEAIRRIQGLDRLPIDVPELDLLLGGGLWRKALGVVVAPSGQGKSVYLSHQAASAMRAGLRVALATLELPEAMIIARIKANLLNMTIDDILDGKLAVAEKKFAKIAPSLGLCVVKEFAAKATTIHDIFSWVKELEVDEGGPIDLLVVDYADKLGTGKSDESTYAVGGTVFEGLRVYAIERNIWCWTASQPRRMTKGQKRIELDDLADSMHKSRVADLVLTMNPVDDSGMLAYYLAKNRMGKTGDTLEGLQTDFAYGRIAPIAHSVNPGISDGLYELQ